MKPPFITSQGRTLLQVPLPNGAHELVAADGGDISEPEWLEFCAHCKKVSEETASKVKARRQQIKRGEA